MLTADQENGFLDAMAAAGLSMHKPLGLVCDGKPRRYRILDEKSGSLNGWYLLFSNMGFVAGTFGSWKTGEKHNWCIAKPETLSKSEREALKLKYEEAKAAQKAEQIKIWAETAVRADKLWNMAKPAAAGAVGDAGTSTGVHQYLLDKRIKPFGIKQLKNGLVVAARNATGKITTLQFIQLDGKKRFLTGGEITGSYFAIGRPESVLIVCEGYATGATLFEATGYAVAVAFNAGNLLAVARAMRDKFPNILIVICGDNDQATDGNPGLSKAQECAEQIGGMALVPTFSPDDSINGKVPTDFNDLSWLYGLAAVRGVVQGKIDAVRPDLARDNVGADDGPPLDADKPKAPATMQDYELIIDESEDFDYLTDFLLRQIAKSGLKKPAVECLIGKIAKKCSTTKATLMDEYKNHSARYGPGAPTQTSDDDVIGKLNKKHAVVPWGGSILIANLEYDPSMKKRYYSYSRRTDFELRYLNRKIFARGDEIGWGEYWLNHPERQEYDGVTFNPGDDVPGYLNLWMGWGMKPVPGDCSDYLNFLGEVTCNGDDDLFDYVINWCAHLVQRPLELPETSLVLRGGEGSGKNTFVKPLAQIVGAEHAIMLTSVNQVTGRFSGHLANAMLVFCNESVWGGDKSAQGVLKSMITDEDQPIEYKGKDITTVKSYRRMIFATNEFWAVPRGMDDRRNVIIDVSNEKKEMFGYFNDLKRKMENGGTAALFDYLLKRDISHWHPRMIPKRLLQSGWDIKVDSAGSVQRWWFGILQQGYLFEDDTIYSDDKGVWPATINKNRLNDIYLGYCNKYKNNHPENSTRVGSVMKDMGILSHRPRVGSSRPYEYKLPELETCRELFCKKFNFPYEEIFGELV